MKVSDLTTEQQAGVAFATSKHNDAIETGETGEDGEKVSPDLSPQEYLDKMITQWADSYRDQAIEAEGRESNLIEKFKALPDADRDAVATEIVTRHAAL